MAPAIGRFATTVVEDLGSAFWLAGNGRAVSTLFGSLATTLKQGGLIVQVPPDAPMITTVIQLDGDITVMVDRALFREAPTPETLERLLAQHKAALVARLPLLDAELTEKMPRSVLGLTRTGWRLSILSGSSGVVAAVFDPSLASLLWQTVYLLPVAVTAALRFAVPRLLRRTLRQ